MRQGLDILSLALLTPMIIEIVCTTNVNRQTQLGLLCGYTCEAVKLRLAAELTQYIPMPRMQLYRKELRQTSCGTFLGSGSW
jgi:hypothetical protein